MLWHLESAFPQVFNTLQVIETSHYFLLFSRSTSPHLVPMRHWLTSLSFNVFDIFVLVTRVLGWQQCLDNSFPLPLHYSVLSPVVPLPDGVWHRATKSAYRFQVLVLSLAVVFRPSPLPTSIKSPWWLLIMVTSSVRRVVLPEDLSVGIKVDAWAHTCGWKDFTDYLKANT